MTMIQCDCGCEFEAERQYCHYVICGDCTDGAVVGRLMGGGEVDAVITDPPYAIYGSSTGLASDVTDDKIVRPFFEMIFRLCETALKWFGHAYVCCDWRSWAAIWDSAKRTRMVTKNLIVWDKGSSGMGNNYANTYELVGFFAKLPPQKVMGDRPVGQRAVLRPNLQRFDRASGEERLHNAAKPIGLMREFVVNSTDIGERILDPFLGSGTTIVGVEQEGRVGYGIEIEPKFCAVTLERLSDLGLAPRLVDSD